MNQEPKSVCAVDGCGEPVRTAPYCNAHYQKSRKYGDPLGGRKPPPPRPDDWICTVQGCDKPLKRGCTQYCAMHYERVRVHGNPGSAEERSRGTCSIEGCERLHYGHGYCLAHYKRWKKYGDPLAGGIPWGAARAFLDTLVKEPWPDDCVQFPFYREANGYGRVHYKGRSIGAHVYVATMAYEPRPSKKHEVCHACGQGHEGCVNPRHLYWGTRSENIEDAFRHGRRSRKA